MVFSVPHPNCVGARLLKMCFLFRFLTFGFVVVVVSLLQKRLEERAAEIEKKTKEKREKDIQERLK